MTPNQYGGKMKFCFYIFSIETCESFSNGAFVSEIYIPILGNFTAGRIPIFKWIRFVDTSL